MSIYLYVKTHNKTGLKYLGKTVKEDPHSYPGSGKVWRRHLAKYGYDYTTEILLETDSEQELKEKGVYYSNLWNVVESKNWANLMIEQGDGGNTSHTTGFKEGIKNRNTNGKNNPMYGRSAIAEQNLRWYNNGIHNIYVTENTQPSDYVSGRINLKRTPHTQAHKEKISKANKGQIPHNRRKVISPDGRVFDSIKAAALYLNLTVSQFRHRHVKNGKWIIK
jgi:hypothetical protein